MDDSPGGTTSCMRRSASAALALGLALGSVALPPIASAAPAPNWDGWYKITFQTDQKSGTSTAAEQWEEPYTAWYQFVTNCSSGACEASVVDGPAPKDNAAQSTTFEWTGTQWSRTNNWRWDCTMADRTITFDQASSVTTYSPQPDGSMKGMFATNIGDGACQGTVYIPLTAIPSQP